MNKYQKQVSKAYKRLNNLCDGYTFIPYREFKRKYKKILEDRKARKAKESE